MKPRLSLLAALSALTLAACQLAKPPAPDAPAPEPVAPPPETRAELPAPGSAAARAAAQQHLKLAAEQLNEGNEERAREEIARVLEVDPTNRTALCYQRGVSADPIAALGRESSAYTVRAGDTLGSLAARSLGDACDFYLLARYNQMRAPRQLQAGQVIRLPGKLALQDPRPAPVSPPAPSPEAPRTPSSEAPVNPAFTSGASSLRSAEQRAAVDSYTREAQAAMRRQDLAGAIRAWDKVLELSPGNELARAKREEAIELQRRLRDVK